MIFDQDRLDDLRWEEQKDRAAEAEAEREAAAVLDPDGIEATNQWLDAWVRRNQ